MYLVFRLINLQHILLFFYNIKTLHCLALWLHFLLASAFKDCHQIQNLNRQGVKIINCSADDCWGLKKESNSLNFSGVKNVADFHNPNIA